MKRGIFNERRIQERQFNGREYGKRKFARRKYSRRQRILIAYTLRAIVCCVLAGMIVLMVCGGIFIYNLLCKDNDTQTMSSNAAFGSNVSGENVNGQNGATGSVAGSKLNSVIGEIAGNHSGIKIVLDPGHGGSDGGTSSGEVVEEDINLSVVLKLKPLLEEKGVEVVLTRDSDETVSLSDRAAIANRADADLFVSIHCNYYEDDDSVNGLECYYYDGSKEGKALAEGIISQLEESGEIETRNAKESNFYVLRKTNVPAVLVEIGYLSNTQECRRLASAEYQETLAEELADSILESVKVLY